MVEVAVQEEISVEEFEKMLKNSRKARYKTKTYTTFFNNSVMAKILDLLSNNPKTPIFTNDFIEKIDISRKSLYSNMLILTSFGIVDEIEVGKKKFYVLNNDSIITKHISKLRDILDVNQ